MDKLKKENLHHAYLLIGERQELLSMLLAKMHVLGIKTTANPDFLLYQLDILKIDTAREIKEKATEKIFSDYPDAKKVFVIAANQFLIEAQNTLLKVFEEPAPGVHFFVVAPTSQTFLSTLLSRLQMLVVESDSTPKDDALKFLKMNLSERLNYIKDLLIDTTEDEDEISNSPRTVALRFINNLEQMLHDKLRNGVKISPEVFEHICRVRENLRQPGSAPKMLLESVALAIAEKMC